MRGDALPGAARSVVVVAVALLTVTAVLASVPVASAEQSESEPNDSRENAQSVPVGEEITGETTQGDEDWFEFTVQAGESINVTAFGDSTGRTEFTLQDPDGGFIVSRDVTGSSTTIGTTATRSGTYYLRAEPSRDSSFGASYDFTVETYTTDAFEPNEDRANATQVAVGEEVTGEIETGDEDWFGFTVQRGETVNVTAFGDSSGKTKFTLQDPDGGFIQSDKTRGGSVTIGTTATRSGTYYLRAEPSRDSSFGASYDFTVETYTTDAFEPNEDRANATQVTVGEEVTGEISTGDEDWFAFPVERGETINLTASAGTRSNTKFWLKDPNGGFIQSDKTRGGSVTIGTTATRSDTYYVQVTGSGRRLGASYDFTVDTYTTDPFEPNEDRANATRLYENPFPSDTAQLSRGDSDWFAFRAGQGETIDATAFGRARSDTKFWLRDPGGGFIGSNSAAGGSVTLDTTAATTGTYYLQVSGGGDRFGAVYNVTVDLPGETLGLANDRFERPNPPVGNQDRANATDLGSGLYPDLGIVDDDRDVFAVDLSAGERLGASIAFNHTENDLALALANDAGTTVRSANSSTDGERVAYTAPGAGTYYLTVSGEAGAAAHYTLDLDVIQEVDVTVGAGSDTLSPGNTTTYPVNVTSVSAGLSTANLSLASTNTSVVAIQSVGAAATGSVNATVAADNGSVTANVTGLDPAAGGVVTVARLTVEAVENGSATLTGSATVATSSGFDYPIRSSQNTTVTVAPPGSLEHESGVSMRLFTAVAGSDGELDRTDVIAMVGAYVRSQPVDGVAVTRADVLALVQYYVLNA